MKHAHVCIYSYTYIYIYIYMGVAGLGVEVEKIGKVGKVGIRSGPVRSGLKKIRDKKSGPVRSGSGRKSGPVRKIRSGPKNHCKIRSGPVLVHPCYIYALLLGLCIVMTPPKPSKTINLIKIGVLWAGKNLWGYGRKVHAKFWPWVTLGPEL